MLLGAAILIAIALTKQHTFSWLLLGAYFVVAAFAMNWYVFFAGRRDIAAYFQYALLMTLVWGAIAASGLTILYPHDLLLRVTGVVVFLWGLLTFAWVLTTKRN